jgi:seryl-tRNA synthetase
MARSRKILGFLLVTLFGAYGCAKGPPDRTEKSTTPEAKVQRLEDDYRSVLAAREQLRHKLNAAEERQAQLQKQFDQEREALKAEVKSRTAERDSVAFQYDGFRKSLKELIAQAETTANPSGSISPAAIGANVAPMPSEAGTGLRN